MMTKSMSTPLRFATLSVMTAWLPSSAAPAATSGLTGFPFSDEDLNYSVNWPSGISLGEAHLHAKHAGTNWNFELTLDAGGPGYAVKDSYHADTVPDFCAVSFERSTSHGSRTAKERETIDREHG